MVDLQVIPRIREVDAQDIPPRHSRRWKALARDLLLRLEQTPSNKALEVPLESEDAVSRASRALPYYFNLCKGKGAVKLICRDDTLYVQRTKRWTKGDLRERTPWSRWEREGGDDDD